MASLRYSHCIRAHAMKQLKLMVLNYKNVSFYHKLPQHINMDLKPQTSAAVLCTEPTIDMHIP